MKKFNLCFIRNFTELCKEKTVTSEIFKLRPIFGNYRVGRNTKLEAFQTHSHLVFVLKMSLIDQQKTIQPSFVPHPYL